MRHPQLPHVPHAERVRMVDLQPWLRRQGRRVDAREQVRGAYEVFTSMGAEGFADRARRELLATGEKVRRRRDDTPGELTPQEEQIARLARDGRTNPEIGAELYLSPRTVEWHLVGVEGPAFDFDHNVSNASSRVCTVRLLAQSGETMD